VIYEMALPKMALAMTEGEIASWYRDVGDRVEKDEVFFDLITEKVTVSVESPVSGIITEIKVQVGETVPVGTIVALIETDD
jgi:pyruvate/2-oxoglutarate dehydrogenase complex dihydrolipoamide acyltransferase (E2) component